MIPAIGDQLAKLDALLEEAVLAELGSEGSVLVHLDHPGSVEALKLEAPRADFSVSTAPRRGQPRRP